MSLRLAPHRTLVKGSPAVTPPALSAPCHEGGWRPGLLAESQEASGLALPRRAPPPGFDSPTPSPSCVWSGQWGGRHSFRALRRQPGFSGAASQRLRFPSPSGLDRTSPASVTQWGQGPWVAMQEGLWGRECTGECSGLGSSHRAPSCRLTAPKSGWPEACRTPPPSQEHPVGENWGCRAGGSAGPTSLCCTRMGM